MNVLLDPERRLVIAHRGGRARGPENTREAMRTAIADGAEGFEFDVRVSADGVVVVFHDPTVVRTTNGTGAVERMTAAELKSLDAGVRSTAARSAPLNSPCRVPTLDEVLSEFPTVPMIIEIKAPLAAAPTRKLIEKHDAEDRCLVDSYSSSALGVFRNSRIPVGAGRNGVVAMLARSFAGSARPVPAAVSALCIPPSYHGVPLPVRHLAETMRAAGKPIHVWTVNKADEARALWAIGAAGMITDDVPAILAARRETFPDAST
ncbi:MAG TPA: glycerophosphodiester phosphodiesterase family protein [Gemmatimonadaceae bacterium]|nr:glycerophosphodiester phosphodiesterase family protein [Gemmatimonadaceae bacterium]